MTDDSRAQLLKQLNEARGSVSRVEKTGHNADDGYHYVEAATLVEEANRALKETGILVLPSITDYHATYGKTGTLVKVGLTYEIVHVESGFSIEKTWVGTGFDSPGDKALYQAITGGTKYFLAHLLAIPFGTDPEAVEPEPESAEAERIREQQDRSAEAPQAVPA